MKILDDLFSTMSSFWAKNLKKNKIAGREKHLKAWNDLKSSLIMFFNDI